MPRSDGYLFHVLLSPNTNLTDINHPSSIVRHLSFKPTQFLGLVLDLPPPAAAELALSLTVPKLARRVPTLSSE
jgi:hypothetical protein